MSGAWDEGVSGRVKCVVHERNEVSGRESGVWKE